MIHAVHSVKYGEEKGKIELRELTKTFNQLTRETNQWINSKNCEDDRENERRGAHQSDVENLSF